MLARISTVTEEVDGQGGWLVSKNYKCSQVFCTTADWQWTAQEKSKVNVLNAGHRCKLFGFAPGKSHRAN